MIKPEGLEGAPRSVTQWSELWAVLESPGLQVVSEAGADTLGDCAHSL